MRILAAAVTAGSLLAQTTAVLDRVTAAIQDYARGITENRFDVSCRLDRFDPTGKLVKTRSTSHRLEFTKGSFRSATDESDPAWSGTFSVHGGRGTVGLELHTDAAAFFPIFCFAPDKRKRLEFETSGSNASGGTTISFHPKQPCKTFRYTSKGFNIQDGSCADGTIMLDEQNPVPLRMKMEGVGFPLSSGKSAMNGYHANAEFQRVPIAGANRPFLFPKHVTAIFEFSEGNVKADCGYALHTGKK